MDGISNLVGERKISITLKGVEYELSTLTVKDMADCERYILSRRPSIGQVIAAAQLEEIKDDRQRNQVRESIIRECISKQTVLQHETEDFLNSILGMAWFVVTATRGRYPELKSIASVVSLISDITVEEMRNAVKAMAIAQEKDILPN